MTARNATDASALAREEDARAVADALARTAPLTPEQRRVMWAALVRSTERTPTAE